MWNTKAYISAVANWKNNHWISKLLVTQSSFSFAKIRDKADRKKLREKILILDRKKDHFMLVLRYVVLVWCHLRWAKLARRVLFQATSPNLLKNEIQVRLKSFLLESLHYILVVLSWVQISVQYFATLLPWNEFHNSRLTKLSLSWQEEFGITHWKSILFKKKSGLSVQITYSSFFNLVSSVVKVHFCQKALCFCHNSKRTNIFLPWNWKFEFWQFLSLP